MAIALLPSEIARLILSYLSDEGLDKTHDQFLDECKYLEECRYYHKKGIKIPKTIHGKKLLDYLFFDSDRNVSVVNTSVETQTDVIKWNSYLAQINDLKTSLPEKVKKRKISTKESNETSPKKDASDDIILIENDNSEISEASDPSNKKSRILIGKTAEKVPGLSVSSLERQLGSIITDASHFLQQQEDQERECRELEEVLRFKDQSKPTDSTSSRVLHSEPAVPVVNSQPVVLANSTNILDANNQQILMEYLANHQRKNAVAKSVNTNLTSQQFMNQMSGINALTVGANSTTAIPIVLNPKTILIEQQGGSITPKVINGKIMIAPNKKDDSTTSQSKLIRPQQTLLPKPALSKDELFKDLTALPKRGPRKYEGPKNKRKIFNRITPTIKQMMASEQKIQSHQTINSTPASTSTPQVASNSPQSSQIITPATTDASALNQADLGQKFVIPERTLNPVPDTEPLVLSSLNASNEEPSHLEPFQTITSTMITSAMNTEPSKSTPVKSSLSKLMSKSDSKMTTEESEEWLKLLGLTKVEKMNTSNKLDDLSDKEVIEVEEETLDEQITPTKSKKEAVEVKSTRSLRTRTLSQRR